MFERFTDRARRVVVRAQEEARTRHHHQIGTEHLLLGVIHEDDDVPVQVLERLGIQADTVRERIGEQPGQPAGVPDEQIPFAPQAKRALELSLRAALRTRSDYIGSEHILLGLIRTDEGTAGQILAALGADYERTEQLITQVLGETQSETQGGTRDERAQPQAGSGSPLTGGGQAPVTAAGVRYIVDDVDAAIEFYTTQLGFTVEAHPAPAFAILTSGALRLLINQTGGPGGAAQPMPDGRMPAPGGWNRIQLSVRDIDATVDRLRAADATFRNDIVTGAGGRQILVEDPAGNPIELFEPRPA